MLNKNVCPNCGQLYETSLSKCPLCGTAPHVVETADPVQRKRITEAERRQRRSDRKEADQAERRRKRDARFLEDEEEELLIEEEDAQRREEKRRQREARKAARRAERNNAGSIPNSVVPNFTPGPARDGRGPMPIVYEEKDRRRVPRIYLALSTVILAAALLVGGSYMLWKTKTMEIPFYDKLAAKQAETTEPAQTQGGTEAVTTTQAPVVTTLFRGEGAIPCTDITLSETAMVFDEEGMQTQLKAVPAPENTTDECRFTSSDTTVVKVSPVGIVTAVGPGEAVITVSCGEIQKECTVSCTFPEPTAPTLPADVTELVLIKDDMTFKAPGENYLLSVTNVPAGTPVEWESKDESIATVDENGRVVAVGLGTTRVYATVHSSGRTLETFCWVRCVFEE